MRKRHFELMLITNTLNSLDICAQTMFEFFTIQIIILNKSKIMVHHEILITLTLYCKLVRTRDDGSYYIGVWRRL